MGSISYGTVAVDVKPQVSGIWASFAELRDTVAQLHVTTDRVAETVKDFTLPDLSEKVAMQAGAVVSSTVAKSNVAYELQQINESLRDINFKLLSTITKVDM